MLELEILFPDGKAFWETYEGPITLRQILKIHKEDHRYPILAATFNNLDIRLNETVSASGRVEFFDLRTPYANMSYQSSLTFLYIKAVHDIFGKSVKVTIANSLSKGLFTVIHTSGVNDKKAQEIEERMRELVAADIPIEEKTMTKDEAIVYVRENGDKDALRLLRSAPDLNKVYACSLDDERSLFYTHLLPSTRYIKLFDIHRYRNGVIFRFPHPSDPSSIPPYEHQKILYDAFSEETHWGRLMGVSTSAELNELINKNEYRDLIMLSEALHERKINDIALAIRESDRRIILIAGPSSSGKTTFAKRLCIALRVLGIRPLYLGTDDYFINRADMIPDEFGNLDFESIDAVDIDLFTDHMNELLAGQKVDIPEFNFITGEKEFGKRITSIDRTQPIVIEGIHGLNPKLTEGIDDDEKFRIYISPLTQINLDMNHRVPTTDVRMLRRMIRDYRTRGRSARQTIHDWPSVRGGEEIYIFPFNTEADAFFNSQCLYELSVIKKYAEPLLKTITQDMQEYAEAQRMLKFLSFFALIEDDSVIANNSILREFTGGSIIMD